MRTNAPSATALRWSVNGTIDGRPLTAEQLVVVTKVVTGEGGLTQVEWECYRDLCERGRLKVSVNSERVSDEDRRSTR